MRFTTNSGQNDGWKRRASPAGLHLFNRASGLNILLDEIKVPVSLHSRAPRQVSIALTNRCDLACPQCYAPKSRDQLPFDAILRWLTELDSNGSLGVGFGGGEPTLYPEFAKLCHHVVRETGLSASFTTHGHHISAILADELRGGVNFVRVSMDGVGATYEAIRGRPFRALVGCLKRIQTVSKFGINVVVNEHTLRDLDEVSIIGADSGACELLLLPQIPVRGVGAIDTDTLNGLRRWVDLYKGPLKLCINDASSDGFPVCDPLAEEHGLRAYAHIDAQGVLKSSSYAVRGVPLGDLGVLTAMELLTSYPLESGL